MLVDASRVLLLLFHQSFHCVAHLIGSFFLFCMYGITIIEFTLVFMPNAIDIMDLRSEIIFADAKSAVVRIHVKVYIHLRYNSYK